MQLYVEGSREDLFAGVAQEPLDLAMRHDMVHGRIPLIQAFSRDLDGKGLLLTGQQIQLIEATQLTDTGSNNTLGAMDVQLRNDPTGTLAIVADRCSNTPLVISRRFCQVPAELIYSEYSFSLCG